MPFTRRSIIVDLPDLVNVWKRSTCNSHPQERSRNTFILDLPVLNRSSNVNHVLLLVVSPELEAVSRIPYSAVSLELLQLT